jgi:hypothetical protein
MSWGMLASIKFALSVPLSREMPLFLTDMMDILRNEIRLLVQTVVASGTAYMASKGYIEEDRVWKSKHVMEMGKEGGKVTTMARDGYIEENGVSKLRHAKEIGKRGGES